jgi:hypothetical protein
VLEVVHLVRHAGRVDRELLVVCADALVVCVRVGEEAGLEDGVGGRFNDRRHVDRLEGDLLDFGKVVLYVFVEGLGDLA